LSEDRSSAILSVYDPQFPSPNGLSIESGIDFAELRRTRGGYQFVAK